MGSWAVPQVIIFALAAIELVIGLLAVIGGFNADSDPAGRAMAKGFAFVLLLLVLAFTVPALLLAYHNHLLLLAAALILIPPVAFYVLVGF